LQVFFEAKYAMLATIAGLLVSAERNTGRRKCAIEVDTSGSHLAGYPAHAVEVAALHISGKAVGRAIGDLDGFLFGIVAHDGEHRAEYLFFRNRHVGRHVREYGGSREIAAVETRRASAAAGGNRSLFLDALFNQTLHPLELRFAD